jgi:uncharacterized membrane protein
MPLPMGVDPHPSARTSAGTPGLGGLLFALAGILTILVGLRRRSKLRFLYVALGGGLVYRGVTGMSLAERLVDFRSLTRPRHRSRRLRHGSRPGRASFVAWAVTTINRQREPVYLFWREPGNVALIHDWVEQVTPGDGGRERWRMKGPGGMRTTVEMERTEDENLERVAWDAVGPDADAREPLRIRVDMRDRASRRETEVVLTVRLPAASGPLGNLLQHVMGTVAEQHLSHALARARQLLETGEMATTHGQPSGRRRSGEPGGLVPVGPGRRDTVPPTTAGATTPDESGERPPKDRTGDPQVRVG